VWGFAGVEREPVPLLRGVNLVFHTELPIDAAVGARHGDRFLFLLPWRGRTLAGTAYADPRVPAAELAASFRRDLVQAFPWAGLDAARLALVHDGLVPGDLRALWSRSLVVDHAREGAPGLVSALGAKYTTARAVAERAVDAAFRSLGRTPPTCRTARTPLPGARLAADEPEAQARRAVREEMARDLEDVVLRRLELGALGRPKARLLARVTSAAAAELGWDQARLDAARERLEACWPAGA
jgi:glycerol-3-phosphate dehydrogenase